MTKHIDLSFSEIGSLTAKAVRGAGMSWGLAEEAAQAVIWLSRFGLPGAAAFAGMVVKQDQTSYADLSINDIHGLWANSAGPLCPMVSGVTLMDSCVTLGESISVEISDISYPLIFLPFVAGAARQRQQILTLGCEQTWVNCSPSEIHYQGPLEALGVSKAPDLCVVSFSKVTEPNQLFPRHKRALIDVETFAILNEFAHRTYVPATEASRAGAGAGLTDND